LVFGAKLIDISRALWLAELLQYLHVGETLLHNEASELV